MSEIDEFRGRVIATLESLDRTVQEIKTGLERNEQRLRKVEDGIFMHKVIVMAAAAMLSFLWQLLPAGTLKKLIGL